jgi:hypothetical protein
LWDWSCDKIKIYRVQYNIEEGRAAVALLSILMFVKDNA